MVITASAILDTSDRRQYAERQARLHAKEQPRVRELSGFARHEAVSDCAVRRLRARKLTCPFSSKVAVDDDVELAIALSATVTQSPLDALVHVIQEGDEFWFVIRPVRFCFHFILNFILPPCVFSDGSHLKTMAVVRSSVLLVA